MKYVQPYGIANPDQGYINGDPSIGRQGSIPPAESIEHPMREVVHVIEKSVIVPDPENLYQLTEAVRSQRLNFVEDTGPTNALVVAFDPPLTYYPVGFIARVRILHTNTGACTLDAGAGAASIKKPDASELQAGNLPAGAVGEFIWDGTKWQMVNFLGIGDGGGTNIVNVKIPYCVDTSVTPNTITAPFSPAITSLSAGDVLLVKLANTFSGGAVTITVNALSPINLKVNGTNSDPLQGDGVAGGILFLKYDGTNFNFDPLVAITANCTLNVPSTFATVAAALSALRRKTISPTATVTIQIAGGTSGSPYVITPFDIYHGNSDRIVIAGTMLAAAPSIGNFAQNGNGSGTRAADAATNLAMLRTRYGTEIQITAGQTAIKNVGPGQPTVKDILVTGSGTSSCAVTLDVGPSISQHIYCNNIAASGVDSAFFGAGRAQLQSCIATGCTYGFNVQNGGTFVTVGCISVGCGTSGFQALNKASLIMSGNCQSNFSGNVGITSASSSFVSVRDCTSAGNATYDLYSSIMSQMMQSNVTYSSANPTIGEFGNYNAIILNG